MSSNLSMRVLWVAILMVALHPGALQTRPDYSGTWTFVPPPASQSPGLLRTWTGDPVTITQTATTITIEYVSPSRANAPVKTVYNLDGSETRTIDRNSLPASQERVSRASWRGAHLVLTTIVPRVDAPTGVPDPVAITEVLSLDSPTVLSLQITRASRALTDTATAVYRRR
jgi:hypothetical protein